MAAHFLLGSIHVLLQGGGTAWWVLGVLAVILAILLFVLLSQSKKQLPENAAPLPEGSEVSAHAIVEPAALEIEAVKTAPPGEPAEAPARELDQSQPALEIEECDLETDILPVILSAGEGGDDLKRIHGITPSIVNVLNAAGIHTFAQLSAASPMQLEQILRSAGMRLSNSECWPKQACLAAAGDWDGLERMKQQ